MIMARLLRRIISRFYLHTTGIKNDYIRNYLVRSYIHDYQEHKLPYGEIWQVHRRGFVVSDWMLLGLNKENYRHYLSNVQYFRMHPLNKGFSNIIDDKWTFKKACAETELAGYLPGYYFRIDSKGTILTLMDWNAKDNQPVEAELINCLRSRGKLAIKRSAGSLGEGFYKAEFRENGYYLNNVLKTEQQLLETLKELKDYLITEYLSPNRYLSEFCDRTPNTIRYLIGRVNGKMQYLKGFVRFGTEKTGNVENYNSGGVLCYLDEKGRFFEGNIIDSKSGRNLRISKHPDNQKILQGQIPYWDEVQRMGEAFGECFPESQYLGIDVVITSENKVKVLEINSLTSLDALQLDESVFEGRAKSFFMSHIEA